MKLAIITDAACDLAANFIEDFGIEILPMKIIKGESVFLDTKEPLITADIREGIKDNGKAYKIEPLTSEELRQYLLKILTNPSKESFLFLMSSSSRGETYNNVVTALSKIMPEVRTIRQKNESKTNIQFEIIDSMQISTGLGILISEAILNAKKNISFEDLIRKVKQSSNYTQSFLIPEKLNQLYSKNTGQNDASVGFGSFLLGSALDIKPILQTHKGVTKIVGKAKGFDKALEMIVKLLILDIRNKKLLLKNISISYGGDSNKRKELMESNIYIKLKTVADEHGVSLNVSKMGSTMIVSVGADAISIGYISSNIAKDEG